ncbi:hypothetical protein BCR44DRAFT_1173258 [Catenaria anguillulae PL171]|uniref:Uncharacterized protein n=1 Tax=Catenaria anguillulae PL171 TaxID=765915 RepID=A0A1Y2I0I3_9FUNG|nr:hypothetical protein BCR44DRAFT_1173258 [Catenaria anguillulae PL171]
MIVALRQVNWRTIYFPKHTQNLSNRRLSIICSYSLIFILDSHALSGLWSDITDSLSARRFPVDPIPLFSLHFWSTSLCIQHSTFPTMPLHTPTPLGLSASPPRLRGRGDRHPMSPDAGYSPHGNAAPPPCANTLVVPRSPTSSAEPAPRPPPLPPVKTTGMLVAALAAVGCCLLDVRISANVVRLWLFFLGCTDAAVWIPANIPSDLAQCRTFLEQPSQIANSAWAPTNTHIGHIVSRTVPRLCRCAHSRHHCVSVVLFGAWCL